MNFYHFLEREDEGADKDRCPFRDGNFAFTRNFLSLVVEFWEGAWREIFLDQTAAFTSGLHCTLKKISGTKSLVTLKAKIELFAREGYIFILDFVDAVFCGQRCGESAVHIMPRKLTNHLFHRQQINTPV